MSKKYLYLFLSAVLLAGGIFFLKLNSAPVITETKAATSPIIVDHTSVAMFDSIPSQWLTAAKNLTLHYAYTSHGTQINSGILALEKTNSVYGVALRESGTQGLPAAETPSVLRIYGGNPPNTYITPELYWASSAGLSSTRSVANTGNYNFSMWSWCGQQSSNDKETVNTYLANLNSLESQYPNMRFIYMTGHTDGGSATLNTNNELIRSYARANNKVLFDFADIESYDPDGKYYPNTTDACSWCSTWCSTHPADCVGLTSDCAHSHPFNCKLKAKAFWYMMARLAGWDGKTTSSGVVVPPSVPVVPPSTPVTPSNPVVIPPSTTGTSSDKIAPARSSGYPIGSLASGTTSATLSLVTNENATCRYSITVNTAYASMTGTFEIKNGNNHSKTVTGLTDGASYNYYVRCKDTAGNYNSSDYKISFSVAGSATGSNNLSQTGSEPVSKETDTVTTTPAPKTLIQLIQQKFSQLFSSIASIFRKASK